MTTKERGLKCVITHEAEGRLDKRHKIVLPEVWEFSF